MDLCVLHWLASIWKLNGAALTMNKPNVTFKPQILLSVDPLVFWWSQKPNWNWRGTFLILQLNPAKVSECFGIVFSLRFLDKNDVKFIRQNTILSAVNLTLIRWNSINGKSLHNFQIFLGLSINFANTFRSRAESFFLSSSWEIKIRAVRSLFWFRLSIRGNAASSGVNKKLPQQFASNSRNLYRNFASENRLSRHFQQKIV